MIFFPFSTQLLSAAPVIQNVALTEKAEYLLKLGEQNISWAQHLMQLNAGFIAIIAFAFISIVVYILTQLRDLRKEKKINEEKIKQISDLAEEMKRVNNEIEQIKKDMIDAMLTNREKKTTDDDIATFIKEVMKRVPNIEWVNFLKEMMWKENVGLEQLKPAVEDVELHGKIKKAYQEVFVTSFLNDKRAVEWAYQIKVKGVLLPSLLIKEKEREVASQQLYRALSGGKWSGPGR